MTAAARRPSAIAGTALRVHPLVSDRWADFAALFGANGACAGCWCMNWRVTSKQYKAGQGESNRLAMQALVRGGAVPGLIAYAGAEAVGWIAIEPRAAYPRLASSRILFPVDAAPVWSVSCFFIKRGWRGRGVSKALLEAGVAHAVRSGAHIVEGYPVDKSEKTADAFVWTGLASTFRKAGFREVARRSATRPIMRLEL